ncbi:hypothetical protein K435DRAFT_786640 [Dendrothele bispora CBS 962.96]|uniref:Mid2 domain-containing protein n=1 Tax=Dendrothele bispora (strain CBS 962.96) TaxID=1314807 RepID=A0A4S8KPN2_DENBC|nr:hypothetical protein K435DRAFT_786640 [Dendrothele bispora CBS 962.96]
MFPSRFVYLFSVTLSLLLLSKHAQAKHNVTIDNRNSSISYSGDWTFEDDYPGGATDHWTDDEDAKAEFKFTGVAIYYQVHLYPGNAPAGALLSVDNKTPEGVRLYDPRADDDEYAQQLTTAWAVENLQNGTHTLHVAFWPGDDDDEITYVTLDTIVVTVLDEQDAPHSSSTSSSATSTSSSSATSTPTSAPDTSRRDKVSQILKYTGIAIGGLAALGLIATVGPILYRRHQANKAHQNHKFVPLSGGSGSASFGSSNQQQMRSYDYSSVSNSGDPDAEANPFVARGETAYNGQPTYSHHPQGATRYG